MMRFNNDAEQAAWALAEHLVEKAQETLRQAEEALQVYIDGKELTRQRCLVRGISASDAEIRWKETARAKKALGDNSFFTNQATMYFSAAAAQFARARYLRAHGPQAGSVPVHHFSPHLHHGPGRAG